MSNPVKIESKITSYRVVAEKAAAKESTPAAEAVPAVETMHEKKPRPETLGGRTYKIKPPLIDHALYVTINNAVLNEGTEHETRVPFEMFINSKNMEHYQWVSALTLVVSAIFRKGGDCTFLVEELKNVFDPKGGYWKGGGVYMPSIVAELGFILESHMKELGLINNGLDEHQQAAIAEKRAAYEASQANSESTQEEKPNFPANASLCKKCHVKAVVVMDNCPTCLNCGDSKCGG